MMPTDNCPKMFIQVPRHLGETDETVLLLTGDEAPLEPEHLGGDWQEYSPPSKWIGSGSVKTLREFFQTVDISSREKAHGKIRNNMLNYLNRHTPRMPVFATSDMDLD